MQLENFERAHHTAFALPHRPAATVPEHAEPALRILVEINDNCDRPNNAVVEVYSPGRLRHGVHPSVRGLLWCSAERATAHRWGHAGGAKSALAQARLFASWLCHLFAS